jgi:hypothetical protein
MRSAIASASCWLAGRISTMKIYLSSRVTCGNKSCRSRTAGSAWCHGGRAAMVSRSPFAEVQRLHRLALATMLLTPDRLAIRGQFTQRIFEAVLAGCVPLAPADLRAAGQVVPPELIIASHDRYPPRPCSESRSLAAGAAARPPSAIALQTQSAPRSRIWTLSTTTTSGTRWRQTSLLRSSPPTTCTCRLVAWTSTRQ